MKHAMSLGPGVMVGTFVFVETSDSKVFTLSVAFVAGSRLMMYSSPGIDSRNGVHLSAIACVATMTADASQSLTMNSQSFASCASYMGTNATPSPKHA